jgi:hypothetical protein
MCSKRVRPPPQDAAPGAEPQISNAIKSQWAPEFGGAVLFVIALGGGFNNVTEQNVPGAFPVDGPNGVVLILHHLVDHPVQVKVDEVIVEPTAGTRICSDPQAAVEGPEESTDG